jgi:hypothetical protein
MKQQKPKFSSKRRKLSQNKFAMSSVNFAKLQTELRLAIAKSKIFIKLKIN